MKVLSTVIELQTLLRKMHLSPLGLVPTMGALHEGHLSLAESAVKQCPVIVVSIFVNPTQFNDKNDLKNYPRTFEKDSKMLMDLNVDYVFFPTEKEMYPEESTDVWDFGMLDKVMEGAHRPGHFNGVAIIVKKLFDIVMPHKAYFGLKDFQQLAIIKEMLCRLQYPIEIVECAIVREIDGLAMSSRNALLTVDERKHAVTISKVLFLANSDAKSLSVKDLENNVFDLINKDELLSVEYFQIVHSLSLQPINSWEEPNIKVGCVAVKIGKVRLIDNIVFSV